MKARQCPAPPPRATIRLQFHAHFTPDDAAAIVPYLARLGISHIYASPLLAARRGSPHGYDVVDPTAINPALGGRPALERLAAILRRYGMGLILDIVPNHMAADATENPWWRDVLAKGRASRYARFFDIDWEAPGSSGRILLPILGRPYAEALAAGEIRAVADDAGRAAEIAYFGHRFPLAAPAAAPADAEALHRLLERQHYRLADWKMAACAINWRRFFNINGLVALNAERAEVFRATHALIFDLVAAGLVQGLRVDHIDGLADPAAYCRRLGSALRRSLPLDTRGYLVVEKILAPGEALRTDWRVDGTTGYDFMADVIALLHDPAGERPLSELWTHLTGAPADFAAVALQARTEILAQNFAADAARLVRALQRAAASGIARRTPSQTALTRVLSAMLCRFNAYRSYVSAIGSSTADAALLDAAVAAAAASLSRGDRVLLAWVRKLLLRPAGTGPGGRAHRESQVRFQQLTATLAAKAVEDTAFYRYGRLLSLNEVGSSPARFALSPDGFHAACLLRQAQFPHTLLATATHDHKRGEDVRARLAVLSEIPGQWSAQVERWMRSNEPRRQILAEGPAPSPADELMLYQSLVGAWPATLDATNADGVDEFAERIAEWQQKALREADRRTSWAFPDHEYEAACRAFLRGMLADPALRQELAAFAARLGPAGAVNGLAETLLKFTVPGIPDLYQGCEFWDESLVDPDNRRPVDFAAREAALVLDVPLRDLLADWRNGRIKQALIARLLTVRARLPKLFAAGRYLPLSASGPHASHVLAFLRIEGSQQLLAVAPRLPAASLGSADIPLPDPSRWTDTYIRLPSGAAKVWRDILDDRDFSTPTPNVALARLLESLPVACWVAGAAGPPT